MGGTVKRAYFPTGVSQLFVQLLQLLVWSQLPEEGQEIIMLCFSALLIDTQNLQI